MTYDSGREKLKLTEAYTVIRDYMRDKCAFNADEAINLEDSPERVAKGFMEMIATREEIITGLQEHLCRIFPVDTKPKNTGGKQFGVAIVESPIMASGLCPHHFLPITYQLTYAYNSMYVIGTNDQMVESVIGLSKLPRIAKLLARRPIVQEQFNKDLVDVLLTNTIANGYKVLEENQIGIRAKFAMAIVSGVHMCMKCRGVKSDNDTTTLYYDGKAPEHVINFVMQRHFQACK